MRAILISVALCLLAWTGACGITAGDDDGGAGPTVLDLEVTTWDLAGDALELDLRGPVAGTLLTVTYYIFGSNDYLGNTSMIPLGHQRLDEQGFGPLAAGDELLGVDLGPWSSYAYVYLYAVGAEPAVAMYLAPGRRYEISVH